MTHNLRRYLPTIRKAIAAAATTGLGAVAAAMLDGNLTGPELVAAAGLALAGGVTVYATPANAARSRPRRRAAMR